MCWCNLHGHNKGRVWREVKQREILPLQMKCNSLSQVFDDLIECPPLGDDADLHTLSNIVLLSTGG